MPHPVAEMLFILVFLSLPAATLLGIVVALASAVAHRRPSRPREASRLTEAHA